MAHKKIILKRKPGLYLKDTGTKGRGVFCTTAIKKGEELTIDYGEEYFDEFIRPKGCLCGGAHCRKPREQLAL